MENLNLVLSITGQEIRALREFQPFQREFEAFNLFCERFFLTSFTVLNILLAFSTIHKSSFQFGKIVLSREIFHRFLVLSFCVWGSGMAQWLYVAVT